jgi:peptidoglycan/xylan/chitin deacetylase (PgdA/CDA1 family)
MNMKFLITVDVEADNQWREEPLATIENVFRLTRFHGLATSYGFKPTYLLSYEVAADRRAAAMLKPWQDGEDAEIGAHLHPWTTPPFGPLDSVKRFPSELGDEELRQKLVNLTEVIEKNFGRRPRSYRAGRFGLDERQVGLLEELGYLVDCSVTPKISWQSYGGPDFRRAAVVPRFLREEGGKFPLIEAPVTILHTGFLRGEDGALARLSARLPDNLPKKILNRLLFRRKWLRIFRDSKAADWVALLRSAEENHLPVMEFMIHSSELMAGCSPYAKTEDEVEFIFHQLEALFAVFQKRGLVGVTLSQFALPLCPT